MYSYTPRGICATQIDFDIKDGCVHNVSFTRGCPGNHLGLAALAEGMPVRDVITRLEGIRCGERDTSCPDQLAQALKAYV
ncbi:TIGR03905 family TSCPD domain-containing protein [Megasphaera hominis]|jgi:uncharacterized protein (TIGR03905 family)|uniref:ribonucleoside-diphosphate reductase n=1 Tax=Megasphaera hominis TaxID=159836 RepID=A0ABR6VKW6_9FIRM|nr:TIGR03905 family TSCPD domain-containing protein [Megasphaera hominis]MBC3537836.1 TIGR03905 family TSCPD domain-containing protein [Megasphaera hominis]